MYTEKVRIYPNKTQKKTIDQILWNCKNLYNYLLELNLKTYRESKQHLLHLKFLDKPAQKFIMKKLPSTIRQNVCERLTNAFEMFFEKLNYFPKFKSINQYRSFTYKAYKHGFNFDKNHIKITMIGKMKAIFTRELLGIPKTCTIKKMKSGKYYAFITLDDKDVEKVKIENRKPYISIDLGVSKFLTDQDGNYLSSPRFLRKNLKKLRRAQRELSRKKRGSNNREKARIKVVKLYEKVANTRRDYHFKVAYYLVTNYNEIFCEDLHVKSMFPGKSRQAKKARRALYDVALYSFLVVLQQMCEVYSCKLTKVDPQYTSQICNNCGTIVKKSLSDRIHSCPHCGLVIDRDVNAARNILQRGKNLSVGTTGGTDNVPELVEISIPGI